MAASSTKLPDRDSVQRWLVAIGLTSAAEDARRLDVDASNALALMGGHAACEALLGLLAGIRRYKQGDEYGFPRLLDEAAKRVALDGALADDLEAMHRMRNGFVHASNTVPAREAERATSAARRLLELLPDSHALPAGAGVATAVASIIETEAVGIWLRHAETMLALDEVIQAADDGARALDAALSRSRPRLRRDTRRSAMEISRSMRAMEYGGIDHHAEEVDRRLDELTEWVVPLALGLSPRGYSRIRGVVGASSRGDMSGHPVPIERPRTAPKGADVKGALSTISEVIFRLWAIGSLRPLKGDDQLVELAQEFLANPTGVAAKGYGTWTDES